MANKDIKKAGKFASVFQTTFLFLRYYFTNNKLTEPINLKYMN